MDAETARKITKRNEKRIRKEWLGKERRRKKKIIDGFNVDYFLEDIFKKIQEVSKDGGNRVCYNLCRFEGSWNEDRSEEKRIIGEHLAKLLRQKKFKAECKESFTSGGEYFGTNILIIYIANTW